MGLMQYFKEKKFDISLLLILTGGSLLAVSAMAVLAKEGDTTMWNDIAATLGGWKYWSALLSGTMFTIGLFYLFDFTSKHREFNRLIIVPGKSKFIQNQDRIEELAWRLGIKYEKKVVERKKELHVK